MALFAVLIPGSLPKTDFVQIEPSKWILQVDNLTSSFVVYLTGVAPLPPDHGLGIYLCSAHDGQWNYVGHLVNEVPSAILTVPTAMQSVAQQCRATVGITVESLATLVNLGVPVTQSESQYRAATHLEIARRIGKHLYTFLCSYSRTIPYAAYLTLFPANPFTNGGRPTLEGDDLASIQRGPDHEILVLPTSWADKWWSKLQSNMAKDMSFWKTGD
jgi:hypothetical protein